MKIRRTLILCIIGLVLWLAWGASVNEDENADKAAEEVTDEVTGINTEEILKKWQRKNIADSTEILERITADGAEISNVDADRIALYVSARKLWEPEDDNSYYYAWSDLGGSGKPELAILRQADENDGYEIHFYIVNEEKEIQEVICEDSIDIPSDSLPTGKVYQDYSNGSHRRVYSTQSSCYRVYDCSYSDDEGYWRYQVKEDSLPVATQWEIMTAEKLTWKDFGVQTGHLTDEALQEELKTSYTAFQLSRESRNVQKIINRIQLSLECSEEENESTFHQFTNKAEQGEPTWAIFTRYTKEHDPIPVYVDYDGEDFYGIWDESSTPYAVLECPYHGFRYQYMKTFLTPGEDGRARKTIILTNKEDLSPQDLDGDYGAAGEYPEYLILYGDLVSEDPLCRATDTVETAKGDFVKRNGVYLIENGKQLELLSKMVAEGKEIEPGVDAASAFYRLCNDVGVKDFLWIGSEKSPFYGSFLGDGYVITGVYFNIHWGGGRWRNDHVRYDFNNWIKTGTRCTIGNEETLEEVREKLMAVPPESIHIEIESEGLDMQPIAESVQECWNRNHYGNHYFVQIDNLNLQEGSYSRWAQDSEALLPFLDLFGEEAGAIMRQAAEEEDSYVSFLRLEHIDGLDVCSFAVRVSEKEQYHVMVRGEWEDTEVPFQHLVIPSTGYSKFFLSEFSDYNILQADINFDGKEDLLIEEGGNSGTGGSFRHYRAVVWDEEQGEFAWYPSFPKEASDLELNAKRVINHYRSGVSYEVVCEYGLVDGEYVKTRELIDEYHMATNSSTLSYYEMGVLVEVHDTTDMSASEFEALYETLYSDLNFWSKG